MTYQKMDNESGIAYAWMTITLFIIISGISIAVFYVVINKVIDGPNGDQSIGINHDIKEGKQSQQSRGAMQFNIDFATNAPIMLVLSILVFAVARAIVVRKVP
jgi:hypothetical protein